jgi:long-chain acyl-CoA synthetase
VRNVAVLGAGRKELTAIVCIDQDAVGHWAEERGTSFTSYADLSQKPEVSELVASVLRHVNELLLEPLRVRRFVNLHKDFDADDGEITRTRKLRRNVIEERYASLIDALYSSRKVQHVETQVKFEDGRTGMVAADLAIAEARTFAAVRPGQQPSMGRHPFA